VFVEDDDYRFYLLENVYAAPRMRFVASSEARPVDSASSAVGQLLEGDDGALFVEAEASAFPDDEGVLLRPAASFVTGVTGPERNVAVVDVHVPGFLVVSDAMYPGWRARVNGEPAPLFAANALEKAVPLEAGRYHVEVVFASSSFRTGARVSVASLAVSLLVLVTSFARAFLRRRAPAQPAAE